MSIAPIGVLTISFIPLSYIDISVDPPPPTNTATFSFTCLVAPITVNSFSFSGVIISNFNPVFVSKFSRNSDFSFSSNVLKILVPHTYILFKSLSNSFTSFIRISTSFGFNLFSALFHQIYQILYMLIQLLL